MFVYLVVLIVCVFLAHIADKYNSRKILFLLSFILVCFTGFRGYSVGIDTENYVEIWDSIFIERAVFIEPGYIYLNKFLQNFTDNPTLLFVVCSIIIYPLIIYRLWDFKYIASFPMMVVTFYMYGLMHSMNVVRQYMAVAIVFYFTRYLFRGSYVKYCLGILIASLFHYSSLIALSLFAIELNKWKHLSKSSKRFLVIGMTCIPFVSFILLDFVTSEYGGYFNEVSKDFGFMTVVKAAFIVIVSILYQIPKRYKSASIDIYNVVRTTIILSLLGLALESVGYFFPFMGRMGLIFSMFSIIFWGILYKSQNTVNVVFCTLFYILLIIYPFMVSMLYNGFGTIPYSSIF